MARLTRLLLALILIAVPATVRADSQDIAAASRAVVRVALVATNGDNAYFVGHGSGVVVAPGRVLTNAHVVELTRTEPNIVIGIIPAEGTKSYGGKVVAFSPGNDLALISVQGAALPIATFFAGATEDGQAVTAIGYPGSVDRAQGMELKDIIRPMSAVRTSGTISAGRSSKQYDTVLHTAPLAQGNSGGPLVDSCGRVLGLNSFGSLSDGNDAEYGFAVSNREIASFLRQADVQFQRTIEPCRSLADVEAADRAAEDKAKADAERAASEAALKSREASLEARETAQQSVIAGRENMMALAAVLLAASVLSAGAAFLSANQGRNERARWLGIGGGVLFVLALLAFLLRPGFDSVAGSAREGMPANASAGGGSTITAAIDGEDGAYLCRIDSGRSRVTVSDTSDVPIEWTRDGCINGKTQLTQSAKGWSRTFVANDEPAISVRSFDPATGTYRSDKYLVDASTADAARERRKSLNLNGCSADPDKLAALARLQDEVRALLPPQPNERLVYACRRAESASGAKAGN